LDTDLSETTDVSAQHQAVVERLSLEAQRIRAETVKGDGPPSQAKKGQE